MRNRRRFTAEFTAQVVLDVVAGAQSQAETCRKHRLEPNLVALWNATLLERACLVRGSDSALSAEQAQIAALEAHGISDVSWTRS